MIPEVVILCGGYGTRVRQISKKLPKALLSINQKPFLYWVLKNLENQGVKKVFLCIGYKGYLIKSFVKKNKNNFNLKIICSSENSKNLLGTGGAIKKILKKLNSYFYIMQGDTFLFMNLKKMLLSFQKKKKPILMMVYKNFDKKHKNNIILGKNYLHYDKNIFENRMKYIDYGVMLVKKNIFFKTNKTFQISDLLKKQSALKHVAFLKAKDKFLEIGSLHGYKETIKNFKKIYNEIYKIIS
jgi:D-glycero-alpha-D-manno-heptose 1-phosphate guanylyltransferase